MPLVLQPTFDDKTRQEIEQHLEQVRARRLVAAVEYHEGQNAKLQHSNNKLKLKMYNHYERLAKQLAQMDKLDEEIQARLITLSTLKQEIDLNDELISEEV